jgi:hypothetical protein
MKKNIFSILVAIIGLVSLAVSVDAQLPNLVPQNIGLSATTVAPGGSLTVNWKLANTGSGSSPGTVTGVRINQSTTSFSGTTLANVSMPALGGFASTSQSATLTAPTTPGTYYVWIIADNVVSGGITQTSYSDDEQHSVAFTVTTPPQLPNLVPQNISLSTTTVAPGGSLTVNWTLADTTSGSSPSTVTGVRINQSTSSFSGTTLANVSMPALGGFSSTFQSTTLTAPTIPGTYYVWIIADNVISGAIGQSNYADDEQHSVAFTVSPPPLPNLIPQNISLSTTTVAPGGSLTVNWTLANNGSGSSPGTVTGVRINQSTTSFTGTTLASVSMPSLGSFSSTPQSTTLTAPTTPGTYYVWIIADNVISGAITQNNYADDEQHSVAFTVLGTPDYPDATWVPAAASNQGLANRSASDVRWIVIHTTEGTTASAIARFQNSSDPSTPSAHYIVSRDGSILQMVHNKDVSYGCGNLAYNNQCINIEHERYDTFDCTETQYQASAQLVKWLLARYNVSVAFPAGIAPADPLAGSGIIGHIQVPDPSNPALGGGLSHHIDPVNWNWSHYEELIQGPQLPTIVSALPSSGSVVAGGTFTINASVNAPQSQSVLLGASIVPAGTIQNPISDPPHDSVASFNTGNNNVSRQFTVPTGTSAGNYDLQFALWRDVNNNGAIDPGTDLPLTDVYTSPNAVVVTTPLKIVSVSGNLTFGNTYVSGSANGMLTISNAGSTALTVTSIAYPNGFSGNWSGTILAGSSQNVMVTFLPAAAKDFTGNLTVNSDADSGTNKLGVTGTGIVPTLNIVQQENNIVLSWPAAAIGFAVQKSTDLKNWNVVTPAPVNSGGNWTVTNSISSGAMFYRLSF